ncbi:hypothetical protein RB11316 [Rhodopirellula baltica SH 1]|uniref:Uncharacterized protein n=1 Tax=Rhodopirellula baltica (strain DSM 10527 / NCIMB 13988 / SH1) TaxID=243090 RepID=Q7UEI2_RHOBA|nr:hypothetical protein RB11316 [Rhodopirellula baltica SH 1]
MTGLANSHLMKFSSVYGGVQSQSSRNDFANDSIVEANACRMFKPRFTPPIAVMLGNETAPTIERSISDDPLLLQRPELNHFRFNSTAKQGSTSSANPIMTPTPIVFGPAFAGLEYWRIVAELNVGSLQRK